MVYCPKTCLHSGLGVGSAEAWKELPWCTSIERRRRLKFKFRCTMDYHDHHSCRFLSSGSILNLCSEPTKLMVLVVEGMHLLPPFFPSFQDVHSRQLPRDRGLGGREHQCLPSTTKDFVDSVYRVYTFGIYHRNLQRKMVLVVNALGHGRKNRGAHRSYLGIARRARSI